MKDLGFWLMWGFIYLQFLAVVYCLINKKDTRTFMAGYIWWAFFPAFLCGLVATL